MNDVVPAAARDVAVFDPQKTKRVDAQANAVIEYAKTVKDWPLLERAVDEKIEQQREFVSWWQKEVSDGKGWKSHGTERRREIEGVTGITHQQVSRWAKRVDHEAEYRAALFGAAYRKAMGDRTVRHSTFEAQIEWYTPIKYVDAAREVMGCIDLDPASANVAQEAIKATRYFTAADDGLKQPWLGRVWLNPPYSQPLIERFVDKMLEERAAERVTEAVMLTHNSTDTGWFHRAAAASSLVCFTRGRVNFVRGDGFTASPPQGQAFFYFGDHLDKFVEVFYEFGICARF